MGIGNDGLPTILVADDSDDLRGMLKEFLELNGYRVLEALDGQEAARKAIRERPDLAVLDLAMPGVDGLSAAAEIRGHIPADAMPIIILTAYDMLEYRAEAVSVGCSGYLTKPINPAALLKTINLLLGKEEDGLKASAAVYD
jgi:two-component system cell cycle response regulator DivK